MEFISGLLRLLVSIGILLQNFIVFRLISTILYQHAVMFRYDGKIFFNIYEIYRSLLMDLLLVFLNIGNYRI